MQFGGSLLASIFLKKVSPIKMKQYADSLYPIEMKQYGDSIYNIIVIV